MKFILNWLAPLLKVNIYHPYKVLLGAFFLSFVGGYYALQLKVDTDLANLLPKNHPNNTNSQTKKRKKYFDDRRTTSHWPYPLRVNGKQPQTYGDNRKIIDYDKLR